MKEPDPHRLASSVGGDILVSDGAGGAICLTPAEVTERHRYHVRELLAAAKRGDEGARNFHSSWETALRMAVAARRDWRKAAA